VLTRSKTSIYVNDELWKRFKSASSRNGTDMSRMLEDLILDELESEDFTSMLSEAAAKSGVVELEFKPIRLRGGKVSDLVRDGRDERENHLSR